MKMRIDISIHLMLLFIRFCWIVWLTHPGISIHLMLLFIPITGFLDGINIEFQYISCYCLSSSILLSISLTHISIHLMLLFIMSGPRLKFQLNFISIHLMLLFIYIQPSQGILLYKFQYISCYCLSLWLVTVVSFVRISIHLMLLFIVGVHVHLLSFLIFQYISCYCLSYSVEGTKAPRIISIHLMLLFIIFSSKNSDIFS